MSRSSRKWLPAIVVPALVVGGIALVPLSAGASVDLPDKTADEVLELIASSTEDSFSGTVEKNADLGLPTLPEGMPGAGDSVGSTLEMLSGSHEARVFVNGSENVRVQITDQFAERNAIMNATDAWLYDSETNVATHVAIPTDARDAMRDKLKGTANTVTPAELADRFLDELGPSTNFSVGTDATVAGRTVYELVLTPKATDTLAESVSIAVDSETGLPLSVSVHADGQEDAAFSVGFTSIDLAEPSADLFTFTPGDGVTVEEQPFPSAPSDKDSSDKRSDNVDPGEKLRMIGTGWDAIVEVSVETASGDATTDPLLDQLTTKVDGGRVFSTSLVTVLLTDDGRVLAGSVPLERLQAAAAEG